jgi:ParB family chromosome partitioning protein
MPKNLKTVSISQIRENPVALRGVNRESEKYLGLVGSMKKKGFLGTITVREKTDKETQELFYELVDGLHRYSAAKDAGLDEINVHVTDLNDDEVLEAQIMQNIHNVETRPVDYSKQLMRILARNPLMTEAELADKLQKSSTWIDKRLGLTRIDSEEIQNLVNTGKINLSNAYTLAKLPSEEQALFVERAMTMPPDEFIPQATNRIKEIKEARRKGLKDTPAEFAPIAHMRKMKDIKEELEQSVVGPQLIKICKIKQPKEAFALAIKWMLHLDDESIRVQEAEFNAREKEKIEKKKAAAAKRAKVKAEKLAKQSEDAKKAEENAVAEMEGKPLPYPDLNKTEEKTSKEKEAA